MGVWWYAHSGSTVCGALDTSDCFDELHLNTMINVCSLSSGLFCPLAISVLDCYVETEAGSVVA